MRFSFHVGRGVGLQYLGCRKLSVPLLVSLPRQPKAECLKGDTGMFVSRSSLLLIPQLKE